MECEYCHNIFSTKTNLNTHQKAAKYCLKLRSEEHSEIICLGCGKKFTQKTSLDRHIKICKQNICIQDLEQKLSDLKSVSKERDFYKDQCEKLIERVRELEQRLENVATAAVSRPTSITTNNTHNQNNNNMLMNLTPFDINKDNFTEKIQDHFDKNYLVNGQKGVAQFVVEKILKDKDGKLMYICTDPSRQIYRFKSNDGIIERDVKAKKLTTALYEEIKSKSYTITNEEIQNGNSDMFLQYSGYFQDIRELEDDNADFRIELASLTSI